MPPHRRLTWAVTGVLALGAVLFYTHFGRNDSVLYADALGYYSYLPALLLHHNAGRMHESEALLPASIQGYFETLSQQPRSPNGHAITQYTCGVALMQLPFFAVGHAWALITREPATGYSAPYLSAIRWSSVVYSILGLWLVYRLLRHYFPEATVMVTLGLLAAGTNFWWFALHQAGMAHPQAFFLVAAILSLARQALQQPDKAYFVGLGACLGLLTLMRPTDLLFLLVPLLVGVGPWVAFRHRLSFLVRNRRALIPGALAFVAVILPQLLFWKVYAGQWIYYSYIGQGFDWGNPHLIAGVFGFNNGWLAYSPVMVLACAGLFLRASGPSIPLAKPVVVPVPVALAD